MRDLEPQSGDVPPALRLAAMAGDILAPLPAAAPFLSAWPIGVGLRPAEPALLPVVAWLETCAGHGTPATAPFLAALLAAARHLAWRQTYGAADFGAGFLDRYGWTELIGLRGPVPSERIACGVLMLGPQTHYPPHAHAAEEIYVPLAGTALWQRGDEDLAARLPGEPIHHRPWVPHAMRTLSEPLVALYVWRGGDLAAKSTIVEPE